MEFNYYSDEDFEFSASVEDTEKTLDAVSTILADEMVAENKFIKKLDPELKTQIVKYTKHVIKRVMLDNDVDWEENYYDELKSYFEKELRQNHYDV